VSRNNARRVWAGVRSLLRPLLLAIFLLGAGVLGVPIRPQEIEEQLGSAARAKAVQVLESEAQDGGEPPGEAEQGFSRVTNLT